MMVLALEGAGRWRRGAAGWMVVGLVGCSGPIPQHGHLDRAVPVPAPRPAVEQETAAVDGAESTDGGGDGTADACGPTTGRRGDGTCTTLATYDAGYVQRVQIPTGEFVMGDIPRLYSVVVGSTPPYVRWSANPPRLRTVESFFIDLQEVTKKAYAACVEEGACTATECPRDEPARVPERFTSTAELFPQTCVSHTQDQAAFTILALNRSLPLLNPNPYEHVNGTCLGGTGQKDGRTFLGMLANGAYGVVRSEDYDRLVSTR